MSETLIRHAHVVDDGGFQFGMDAVTPVLWKFQNRRPAGTYTTFDLTPFHKNERVQEYLRAHQTLVISFADLRRKLLDLIKENENG